MKGKATSRRKTKYQILVSRKSSYCNGRVKKTSLTKAANAYIADAVKKGKSKAEAQKIANKVVNGACTASVSGRKKAAGRKKRTTRRKKAA